MCVLADINAVWTLSDSTSPIDDNGVASLAPTADSYGYHCNNCGSGFADWAGCLGHIVGYDVPTQTVSIQAAEVDAQDNVEVSEPPVSISE